MRRLQSAEEPTPTRSTIRCNSGCHSLRTPGSSILHAFTVSNPFAPLPILFSWLTAKLRPLKQSIRVTNTNSSAAPTPQAPSTKAKTVRLRAPSSSSQVRHFYIPNARLIANASRHRQRRKLEGRCASTGSRSLLDPHHLRQDLRPPAIISASRSRPPRRLFSPTSQQHLATLRNTVSPPQCLCAPVSAAPSRAARRTTRTSQNTPRKQKVTPMSTSPAKKCRL